MKAESSELRLPAYGGQAVIEGVLMRGKRALAMAVRDPEGEIILFDEQLPTLYRSWWARAPFFRGIVSLWDSLSMGMEYLTKSANVQTGEEEKIEGKELVFTMLFSILVGVGLFFLLPALLAGWLENGLQTTAWVSNLIEGLLRLIILVVYMVLIGKMPEIQRTFMYHGAEHKTINAFEAGIDLEPQSVAQQTRVHPRCGTSFILSMVYISILVFTLLGPQPLLWRLISRILLLPVVAGLSYEYIRWAAKNMQKSGFVRALIKPNLWLQSLTTREPSLDMIEVALAAFKRMYTMETAGELQPDTTA